jgi:hypothetical protein
MDLPVSAAWLVPSGVSTPWLIALLRKRIFAGSINREVRGSKFSSTRNSTTLPATSLNASTTGLMTKKPTTASRPPQIPAEKLLTSISKPGLIFSCQRASIRFMLQPPSGPMSIAPMNMGMSAPVITPMVAMAPTTPPRTSYTILPPV